MESVDQRFYRFRSMSIQDVPTIKQWLAEPHVVEWWGDPDEQLALITGDLDEPAMRQFIVECDGLSFGYIQTYDVHAWPQAALADQPRGTLGIDQFIGRPDMIDRGHGSAFIRVFVQELIRSAPRVMTDPHINNKRAIRAYKKAGFCEQRLIDTIEGPALLMMYDK